MIETSSLVFSFLDHLHEIHEVERASLVRLPRLSENTLL